jgi:hypothetical protein
MNMKSIRIKYLNLWRGEFAENYKNRPRLYKALTENEVFFQEDNEVLTITFYVKNEIQQRWIEVVMFDDMAEKFLILSGIKSLDLRIVPEDDLPMA